MKKIVAMVIAMLMVFTMANAEEEKYEKYYTERNIQLYEFLRDSEPEYQEIFARFAVGYVVGSEYYVEDYVIFGSNGIATDAGWGMQLVDGELRHEAFETDMWEQFNKYEENKTFEIVKENEYQTLCNVDDFINKKRGEFDVLWVKYY